MGWTEDGAGTDLRCLPGSKQKLLQLNWNRCSYFAAEDSEAFPGCPRTSWRIQETGWIETGPSHLEISPLRSPQTIALLARNLEIYSKGKRTSGYLDSTKARPSEPEERDSQKSKWKPCPHLLFSLNKQRLVFETGSQLCSLASLAFFM